jgi:metal-sulfur cluster biosynthetic enzyme
MQEDSAQDVVVNAVRQALRTVADPCSISWNTPLDVISMGMVEVTASAKGGVTIVLTATTPFCLMAGQIAEDIVSAARGVDGVEHVDLRVGDSFSWHPGKMEDSARAKLHQIRRAPEGNISHD